MRVKYFNTWREQKELWVAVIPIVQNTTQEKKCVRVCVCLRARAYFQQLVCIYEVVHMLGLDILVSGPLKDKAVWGSAKASFLYRCY